LDPYQTSWQPEQDYWTDETTVSYTNLPRGDYVFRVRALDRALNVETVENTATNTFAFRIVEPTQTLSDPGAFPISPSDGEVTLSASQDIVGLVLIELYNSDDCVGKIYVFDTTPMNWDLPTSSGTYSVSMDNGAIFISSGNNGFFMDKKPDIYEEDGSLVFHIVQTCIGLDSASGFGGSGKLRLTSRLVENRILGDVDVKMLRIQKFGENSPTWIDYFTDTYGFTQNGLNIEYPGDVHLILFDSIIEVNMEYESHQS
jgi:hypothetical protein